MGDDGCKFFQPLNLPGVYSGTAFFLGVKKKLGKGTSSSSKVPLKGDMFLFFWRVFFVFFFGA